MKKLLAGILSGVLCIGLIGCSSSSSTTEESKEETTLEKVQKQGYVTVGFANEKPYAYTTPDGELTGEAVEVARAVLTEMGIKEMKGVLTEFGSLIPGLKAERFDMITAGMFITPERCTEVDFANPEYSIGPAIAVKTGNPLNLNSYDDIKNNKDAKVAVMSGAIEHSYLTKAGIDAGQIQIVPDNPSAVAALQSGRVDTITMSGPALQSLLDSTKDKNLERVKDFDQTEVNGESVRGYGATAFRKGDTEFREAFNQELEKMKESGELLKILQKFGFTEQELPGDQTAQGLCKAK
ncbi:MAG TPA: ectoine/hydroxyectoine ABC transporter substrate-binding protein EhuB [Bacillus sp. (in: firmicutes)]|nr:ectoine/hydroxyectoine ABC transporter substrate-binding protein EhuB [Bacillus sp. (in: firmicutes)]